MLTPRAPLSLLVLLCIASCTSRDELNVRGEQDTVRYCPEPTSPDYAGHPRNAAGYVRYCWPGETSCFCDRDNDCYAEDGYVRCAQPPSDAGPDVTPDATGVSVCSEAVYLDARGIPRSVTTRQIRECFPGEARCFCDRDNDCYRQTGYVACVPPSAADAGADDAPGVGPDAAPDVRPDAAPDAAPDVVPTSGGTCPEAVYLNASGAPVGVTSRHYRWCFPGEARCFCDRDNDCYRLDGYVPCTPPGADAGAEAAPDARPAMDAAAPDVAAPDAAPDAAAPDVVVTPPDSGSLASDPIAYTGTLAVATGLSRSTLRVAGEARTVNVYAPATRGARPPLVLAFHGTNADGALMIDESGARAVADAQGFVVVAPDARWFGESGADYDHPGGNGTYWETRNPSRDANADLLLVRAAIVEAQARYNTDPDRVYAIGHSNGGFMALLVSVALRERIAAFAENSAGMVTCASRPGCRFQGASLSCAGLAAEPGWCGCGGAGLPVAPVVGAAPGFLSHGNADPMVSVQYTCALAARLAAVGAPVQTYVWSGGHYLGANFARNAWAFLAPHRRP